MELFHSRRNTVMETKLLKNRNSDQSLFRIAPDDQCCHTKYLKHNV
jgi:hypothetical protein